jgi:hypothetical protein
MIKKQVCSVLRQQLVRWFSRLRSAEEINDPRARLQCCRPLVLRLNLNLTLTSAAAARRRQPNKKISRAAFFNYHQAPRFGSAATSQFRSDHNENEKGNWTTELFNKSILSRYMVLHFCEKML